MKQWRMRRGASVLAGVAMIAMSASYASARDISVEATDLPTGPETTAKFELRDSDGADVSSFYFKVFFKSSQATLQSVNNANNGMHVMPGAIADDALPVESFTPDADGYDRWQLIAGDAYPSATIGPNGALAELVFKTASTYEGQIDVRVEPYPFEAGRFSDPRTNWYQGDDGAAFSYNLAGPKATYGSPFITAVNYDGTWTGHGVTLQIEGYNFFTGSEGTGAPTTVVTVDGKSYAPTNVSGNHLEVTIPDNDTPISSVGTKTIKVSNGASPYVDVEKSFYVVDRDIAYVDDDFSANGDLKAISTSNPVKIKGANAFSKINDGTTAVNNSGAVQVAAGTYAENVGVSKDISITAASGAKLTSTGSGYHQVLMNITGNATVDGLLFEVDEYVGAAISSVAANSLTLTGNTLNIIGRAANSADNGISPLPAGMANASNWGPRAVLKKGGSLVMTKNTITGVNTTAFMYGLDVRQTNLTMGDANSALGNNLSNSYRDIELTETHGSILSNSFALNVDIQNPSGGALEIAHNAFGNSASILHNEGALTVRGNHNEVDININNNTFTNTGRGVWVGGAKNVTVDTNTFTPAANVSINLDDLGYKPQYTELHLDSNKYAHIMLDSRQVVSTTYADTQVDVKNNTFNDSTANGNAIQVKNLGSKTMDLAFSGNKFNALDSANDNFVKLDDSFNDTIDLTNNSTVDAGAGASVISSAWTLPDLFTVEDHTFHSLDASGTGLVRWVAGNVYVSQNSASIKRGVDAASATDTVNVQGGSSPYVEDSIAITKALTIDGFTTRANAGATADSGAAGVVKVAPAPSVDANGAGTQVSAFTIAASGVTIKDIDIVGQSATQRLSNAIRRAKGASDATTLDNLYIQHVGHYAAGKAPGIYLGANVGAAAALSTVKNSIFDDVDYAGVHVAKGNTEVKNNQFSNMVYQGLYVSQEGNSDFPKIIAQNNSFVSSPVGVRVQSTSSDSVIGGTDADGNHFNIGDTTNGKIALGVQVEEGACTVSGNTFDIVSNTTSYGHFGVWMWKTPVGQNIVSGNHFKNTGNKSNIATAISVVGKRTGDLAGASNDAQTNAQITGNDISGFNTGISLDNSSDSATATDVTINGSNTIANCGTGIRVNGGGATATITGNELTDNPTHLALSKNSTVDSKLVSDMTAADLEAVVNAQTTVKGKTYISAGMADIQGAPVAEAGDFINVRNTINASVIAATAGNTVKAMADTYPEWVAVNKKLRVRGAGAGVTTIEGPNHTPHHPVDLSGTGSIFEQFKVTRDTSTLGWTDASGDQSYGVTVRNGSDITVQDCIITECRNGLYMETAPGSHILRNTITNNRTGAHLVDNITGSEFRNNFITDNWTVGVLFRNQHTGSNPARETTAITMTGNYISGNWYSQVEDRQVNSATLDLSGNWFGVEQVTVTTDPSGEHDYATSRPGGETKPATSKVISGVSSANIDYNAWLPTGVEKSGASTTDLAFEGDFSTLYIGAGSPLAGGEESHISDAVKLLADGAQTGNGRLILATDGTYVDGLAIVDKAVTIKSLSNDKTKVTFAPKTAGQDGISIQSSDVSLNHITLSGATTAYGSAIIRPNTSLWNNTNIVNVAVDHAGNFTGTKKYAVDLRQPVSGGNSTGNQVSSCTFDNCTYAAVALFGGATELRYNTFTNSSYQGIYAAPAHAYPGSSVSGGAKPVLTVTNSSFNTTPVGVRLNTVDDATVIGGSAATPNSFTVGNASDLGIGVSIEACSPMVSYNTMTLHSHPVTAEGETQDSMGVWAWNSKATIDHNNITCPGSGTARGIVAVGKRIGQLAGGGTNMSPNTELVITGNELTGLDVAVAVDNAASAAAATKITVNAFNSIKNNATGVLVNGEYAKAIVNANWIYYNDKGIDIQKATADSDFDGNTLEYSTASQKYVVNTSGNDYDISNSTINNVQASVAVKTLTDAQIWTTQANLVDALDKTGNGHLILKDNNVFVPASKIGADSASNGVLQRAALVSADGNEVRVQAGTYNDGDATFDKNVMLASASGLHQAEIKNTLSAVLQGTGSLTVAGFKFSGAGNLVATSNGYQVSSALAASNLLFDGVTAPVAVTINKVDNNGSSFLSGFVDSEIRNSTNGVIVNESRSVTLTDLNIHDNNGTAIGITKQGTGPGTITPDNITISGCTISHNGFGDTDFETNWNNDAYGIIAASFGNTADVKPYGTNLTLDDNTIEYCGATGVFLSYQDGTTIKNNRIRENGQYKVDQNFISGTNQDGLKIISSKNTTVEDNVIRRNGRNNVLVSAKSTDAADACAGTKIQYNHLDQNLELHDGTGAGLMLQMYNSPSTQVDAQHNWWGHVYGPFNAVSNATGRGASYDPQGGAATLSPWYGERSEVDKWFALNDQDGDGVWDATEDFDLRNDTSADETNRTVKDSDGDGYEDGVELACGSDPLDPVSKPSDIDGHGTSSSYTHLSLVLPKSDANYYSADADNDGYLDFYEIAMGTDPTNASEHPSLGVVDTSAGNADASTQLTSMRKVLVGITPLTGATIMQDNMDVNRDGIVSSADLVGLRRFQTNGAPAYPLPTPVYP